VLFGHKRASSSNLISRSQFIVLVCIWKIWALLSRSGSPNSTCIVSKTCQALLAENLLIYSMLCIKHCRKHVDTLADNSADRTHVSVHLTLYMASMQNAIMLLLMYKLAHAHWLCESLSKPAFLSRRPGLSRAGSRVSGLLVAIRTLMLPRESKPSNWFTISSMVRWTSLSPPEVIATHIVSKQPNDSRLIPA